MRAEMERAAEDVPVPLRLRPRERLAVRADLPDVGAAVGERAGKHGVLAQTADVERRAVQVERRRVGAVESAQLQRRVRRHHERGVILRELDGRTEHVDGIGKDEPTVGDGRGAGERDVLIIEEQVSRARLPQLSLVRRRVGGRRGAVVTILFLVRVGGGVGPVVEDPPRHRQRRVRARHVHLLRADVNVPSAAGHEQRGGEERSVERSGKAVARRGNLRHGGVVDEQVAVPEDAPVGEGDVADVVELAVHVERPAIGVRIEVRVEFVVPVPLERGACGHLHAPAERASPAILDQKDRARIHIRAPAVAVGAGFCRGSVRARARLAQTLIAARRVLQEERTVRAHLDLGRVGCRKGDFLAAQRQRGRCGRIQDDLAHRHGGGHAHGVGAAHRRVRKLNKLKRILKKVRKRLKKRRKKLMV